MDAIEIFYGAYGALLALAIGKLMTSVASLIRKRSDIHIGWLTPLLILLLLLDICSFINSASRLMGLADLSLGIVSTGILACAVYYLAATLVAPDDFAAWPDLDAYYDQHKRLVVGAITVASLLGFELSSALVKGFAETFQARWMGLQATLLLAFYLLVVALFVVRNRAVNVVLLAILNAIFVVVMFTF